MTTISQFIGTAIAVLIGVLSQCTGAAAENSQIPQKIDERMAQRLAAEAHDRDVPLGAFDYDEGMSQTFFVFDGLGAPNGEGSFGYFAVNPWTGEVWALWGCHKLSTPASRKSQAEIRKSFTPTEMKEYGWLSRLKPVCIVED